jgi:hypothetical protein
MDMATGNNNNPLLTRREIYVNEIEFCSTSEVYLFGFVLNCGEFVETQYVISRKDLQVLLSRNGPVGVEILWQIEGLFLHPHSSPAIINLIELFGTIQVFEASEIRLSSPMSESQPGTHVNGQQPQLMFVEEVC